MPNVPIIQMGSLVSAVVQSLDTVNQPEKKVCVPCLQIPAPGLSPLPTIYLTLNSFLHLPNLPTTVGAG